MKLSTRTTYGLRALIYIALNSNNRPIDIKEISKSERISIRYLANILTKLRAGGILKSKKGKYGGFLLAKEPYQITLFDILKILDEKIYLVNCLDEKMNCSKIKFCGARKAWSLLNKCIVETLKKISLSDLITENYTYNYQEF